MLVASVTRIVPSSLSVAAYRSKMARCSRRLTGSLASSGDLGDGEAWGFQAGRQDGA